MLCCLPTSKACARGGLRIQTSITKLAYLLWCQPATGAAIRANQLAASPPWLGLTLLSNLVTEWVRTAQLRGA
jgi:hypothetical protein